MDYVSSPAGVVGRFFFSLYGRIPRLPFIPFTIASYIAFILLINAWSAQHAAVMIYLLNTLVLSVFPLKFLVMSKRLHDVGLSAVFGFPLLIIMTMGLYANFGVGLLHAPAIGLLGFTLWIANRNVSIGSILGLTALAAIVLSDLALMAWPGNRNANRYGAPAKRRDSAVAEHF